MANMAIGTNWAPWNNAPTTWQSAQQPSFASMQRPVNNLLRAMGPESAKAYPMGPNSDVVLFDADMPRFYWVSSDDSGFKSMRTFDFEEVKPIDVTPVTEHDVPYATKDDVDSVKADVSEIKEMLKGLVN